MNSFTERERMKTSKRITQIVLVIMLFVFECICFLLINTEIEDLVDQLFGL